MAGRQIQNDQVNQRPLALAEQPTTFPEPIHQPRARPQNTRHSQVDVLYSQPGIANAHYITPGLEPEMQQYRQPHFVSYNAPPSQPFVGLGHGQHQQGYLGPGTSVQQLYGQGPAAPAGQYAHNWPERQTVGPSGNPTATNVAHNPYPTNWAPMTRQHGSRSNGKRQVIQTVSHAKLLAANYTSGYDPSWQAGPARNPMSYMAHPSSESQFAHTGYTSHPFVPHRNLNPQGGLGNPLLSSPSHGSSGGVDLALSSSPLSNPAAINQTYHPGFTRSQPPRTRNLRGQSGSPHTPRRTDMPPRSHVQRHPQQQVQQRPQASTTRVRFENRKEAMEYLMDGEEKDDRGKWAPPANDSTIPRDDNTRQEYVSRLFKAMVNKTGTLDGRLTRREKLRWGEYSTEDNSYSEAQIEKICWDVLVSWSCPTNSFILNDGAYLQPSSKSRKTCTRRGPFASV